MVSMSLYALFVRYTILLPCTISKRNAVIFFVVKMVLTSVNVTVIPCMCLYGCLLVNLLFRGYWFVPSPQYILMNVVGGIWLPVTVGFYVCIKYRINNYY